MRSLPLRDFILHLHDCYTCLATLVVLNVECLDCSFYVSCFTISTSLSGNKSLACGIYKAKEMMSPGDSDWKLCIRILVENMYDFIMFSLLFISCTLFIFRCYDSNLVCLEF